MSLELDWALLTPLETSFAGRLNSILSTIQRPDYLGPIEVHAFSFGDIPASVEVCDITDVSKELAEAADEDDRERAQAEAAGEEAANAERGSTKASSAIGPGASEYRESTPNLARGEGIKAHPLSFAPSDHLPPPPASPPPSAQSANASFKPSLQLHLHVTYSGNLRADLSTCLLVNYPSPLFMSLPLRIAIVGVVLDAEVVLAVEADRGRAHVSIVEPPVAPGEGTTDSPGQRIIPQILVETEVGNVDKHVLRNVGKVERFIADIVRKLLCDELLYPNFHTIQWA